MQYCLRLVLRRGHLPPVRKWFKDAQTPPKHLCGRTVSVEIGSNAALSLSKAARRSPCNVMARRSHSRMRLRSFGASGEAGSTILRSSIV